MTLKEVLEYKLIDYDSHSLSLYDIFAFVAVLVIARVLLWTVRRVLYRAKAVHLDQGRKAALYSIIKYFVWIIAIVVALQASGINITILLAGSAALFVGLGFGLQNLFNDMVSGIILLFDGTVQVGEVIEVDGIVAEIEAINFRTSSVRTRDDIQMIIPNHKFVSENVINWSKQRKYTRFRLLVSVSYNSDVEEVRNVLLSAMQEHENVLGKPHEPFVRLSEFGSSALDFECIFWSADGFVVDTTASDLRFRIFKVFGERGIQIPFPQTDVHIRTDVRNSGAGAADDSGI